MLRTARILPLVVSVAILLGACSQRDLGRYCFVGAEGGENSNTFALAILNTEAPECGDRLCLKQKGWKCPDDAEGCLDPPVNPEKLRPMCTRECEKNKDCQTGDENVNGCRKFVCQTQGAETGFGDHCICVCLDYIRDSGGNPVDVAVFNSTQNYQPCNLAQ